MGLIRKRWFWYIHHDLYIEPTVEEQKIAIMNKKISRQKRGMFIASTIALTNLNN